MQGSVEGVRQQEILLCFHIYLFIYLYILLLAMQGDKWQPHLRATEKFGLLSLLFELSLIFKCLFQAFPRRGHWRICLISWSHHGAHLYCTEAMSSVPSSLFHSPLLSSYASMTAHTSPLTYPTCIQLQNAPGYVCQCFCTPLCFLRWSYGNQTVAFQL